MAPLLQRAKHFMWLDAFDFPQPLLIVSEARVLFPNSQRGKAPQRRLEDVFELSQSGAETDSDPL